MGFTRLLVGYFTWIHQNFLRKLGSPLGSSFSIILLEFCFLRSFCSRLNGSVGTPSTLVWIATPTDHMGLFTLPNLEEMLIYDQYWPKQILYTCKGGLKCSRHTGHSSKLNNSLFGIDSSTGCGWARISWSFIISKFSLRSSPKDVYQLQPATLQIIGVLQNTTMAGPRESLDVLRKLCKSEGRHIFRIIIIV